MRRSPPALQQVHLGTATILKGWNQSAQGCEERATLGLPPRTPATLKGLSQIVRPVPGRSNGKKRKDWGILRLPPLVEIAAPENAAPHTGFNAGKRAGSPKGFCNK